MRRALVVDCDVHQGDGTADLLGPDPESFTLSLHGARNYPFQRIAFRPRRRHPERHRRRPLPRARSPTLSTTRSRALAPSSRSTSRAPTRGRAIGSAGSSSPRRASGSATSCVLDRLLDAGIAVCVVLAGGYAEDVRDTVDINAATAAEVARRSTAL